MSDLYILVGPPKTATTSLQIALERAAEDFGIFQYHGVFQPRSRNNGSLAKRLHNACLAKSTSSERLAIKKEINDLLASSKSPVVISEEMFLVSQHGSDWTKKLKRLSQLVEPALTTIVIALRNPDNGLRSYYREIFKSLPLIHRLSFKLWCRCSQSQVFNYESLERCVRHFGFKIRFFDMNTLSSGNIAIDAILGRDKGFAGTILDVGHENADPNREASNPQARHLPSIVLYFTTLKRALSLLNIAPPARLADEFTVTIRPGGERRLLIPRNISEPFYKAYGKRLIRCE